MMTIDPTFRKQVRDVLEHLYDTAYLETNPMISQVALTDSASSVTRAQKLRGLIKDLIETLRPQGGSPSNSPEWRCYRALRCRFVQGMSTGQVESELGISLRQLQREFHKGVDAITAILWAQRIPDQPLLPPAKSADNEEIEDMQQELDQWVLNRTACELDVLLEDVTWMLNSALDSSATTIQTNIMPNLPPVMVDATLTRQALFKLLRLLIQSTPAEIQITTLPGEKTIDLKIAYAAPCLTCEEPEWRIACLLFERQGDALTQSANAEMVEVVITLPRLNQRTVLVVDDNQALHQLFERYLSPGHYAVVHAFNGPEALEQADAVQPDFITLDVMMAGMDGWQVLRDLQKNPHTCAIPILVCSVLKEPELAISLGARAYLKKPVERLQLQAALEKLAAAAPPTAPQDSGSSR